MLSGCICAGARPNPRAGPTTGSDLSGGTTFRRCRLPLPPGQSCQQAAAVQWRIGPKLFRGWRLFGSGRAENQGLSLVYIKVLQQDENH